VFDVLCVGLTCCDLIFTNLNEPGKEVFGDRCLVKAGGAANTPMAMRRLGLDPVFVTALGDDIFGKAAFEYIRSIGLETEGILFGERLRTSVTSVLSAGGDRAFVSCFEDCFYERMTKNGRIYTKLPPYACICF
jgi:sugar/nucleoside kinase (ribokinase family)